MSSAPLNRSTPQPIPLRRVDRSGRPASLPLPLSSFVGRDQEVEAVVGLLQRPGVRLLTLTGPGGVGKSRLVIRTAEQLTPEFGDALWFVLLAAVPDAELVPAAIAEQLGLREAGAAPIIDQIKGYLLPQQGLLILDNVEHLTAAGPLISDLLAACPSLRVLATSREVLRLSGEHIYAVPPLPVPDPGDGLAVDQPPVTDAMQLFAERATAARADFELTADNALAVAAICQRLDGLPLAIELAAARISAFDPTALLDRLERRLPLLTSGPRDVPRRLQTMRDAIAWSIDVLPVEEQRLFRRLSVFIGGFTLEAAQIAAADGADEGYLAVDGVTSLIGKSVLRQGTSAGGMRFWMLETIREYGLELLDASGEDAAARQAHANWVLDYAERAGPELNGPDQSSWTERLQAEIGNIRAALAWLREQEDTERALRLACAIGWFWTMPGRFHEAHDLFETLVAMPGAADTPDLLASAIVTTAELENWLGRYPRAEALYAQALTIYRALDDRRNIATALRGLGSVAIDQQKPAEALDLLEESLVYAREMNQQWEVAALTNLMGIASFAIEDSEAALIRHEEALARWRDLQDTTYISAALTNIGLVSFAVGQFDRAATAYSESLALATAFDDRYHVVRAIEGFGLLAIARAEFALGARLLGAAQGQLESFGTPRRPGAQALLDRAIARAQRALGEERFAEAWTHGRGLSLAHAVDGARSASAIPSRPAASHNLTRREVEVLRLVAEGLTDREIGERLYISRRTVSHHVTAILAKLDVSSRRDAAEQAHQLGLA